MKKITFLLFLLLVTTLNYAQDIIIDENFDGASVPAGWHAGHNLGTGTQIWTFGSGVVSDYIGSFSTNAAIFDDDAAGNTGNHDNVWLWYDSIDVSGYTQLVLQYEYALDEVGEGETLSVGIFDTVDNVWIPIRVYDIDTDPTEDSIDIMAAIAANPNVDSSDLYIGFGYDDVSSAWGYGAGIDNVKLIGANQADSVNDYCMNAVDVTVYAEGTGSTSATTIANNWGATDSSPYNGTPVCGNFSGGDIWFTFIAPPTGDIKIVVPELGEWSSFANALYIGGTCAETAALGCEVNYDINLSVPVEVEYTDLTPGASYVLRVWDYNNDDFGEVSFYIEEIGSIAGVDDVVVDGFTLFPNPVEDVLNVSYQSKIDKIAIYNIIGQEVKVLIPNSSNLEVDLSNLESGIYVVKVLSNDKEMIKKFIKK